MPFYPNTAPNGYPNPGDFNRAVLPRKIDNILYIVVEDLIDTLDGIISLYFPHSFR